MRYSFLDLSKNYLGNSHATAINDVGQVVGYADVENDSGHIVHHALIWDPEMIDLNDDWPKGSSAAFALNDGGHVVGGTALISDLAPPPGASAFFCDNPLAPLPALSSLDEVTSIARGINKDDIIVGQRQPPGKSWYPVYWPSPADTPKLLTPHDNTKGVLDLKPNGLGGKAAAINSIGTIVGRADYDLNGNFVGCLWQDYDASPQALNPPSSFPQSYAWAINNEGLVVGIYGPGVGANGQNPIEATPATRYACAWRLARADRGSKFQVIPLFPDPPPLSFA